MIIAQVVVNFIFLYIVTSILFFLLIVKFLKADRDKIVEMFFVSMGIGPILTSFLLKIIFKFFPGQSDLFYVSCIIFFYLAILVYVMDYVKKLEEVVGYIHFSWQRFKNELVVLDWILICMSIVIFLAIFFKAIVHPLDANDPLLYGKMARLLYDSKDFSSYPWVTPDPRTGYYGISTHPLGYHLLIVATYILEGGPHFILLFKTIAPVYLLYLAILSFYLLSKVSVRYAAYAPLLLFSCPYILNLASISHVDMIRLYFFFLVFAYLSIFLKNASFKENLVFGLIVGFAMYTHSINLIILPFAGAVIFLFGNMRIGKKILLFIVITMVALSVCGDRYYYNVKTFHNPISSDLEHVFKSKKIDWIKYTAVKRGVDSFAGKIYEGFGAYLMEVSKFGFVYWLFIASLIFLRIDSEGDFTRKIFIVVILMFYSLVVISILRDNISIVKNSRYLLTVYPLIAYCSGHLLGSIREKIIK